MLGHITLFLINTAIISNIIILLSIVLGVLLIYIFISKIYRYIPKSISFLKNLFKGVFYSLDSGELETNYEIEKTIEFAGFSYDEEQDMYYSNKDSWQRKFGYCRLYDEAAAPFGMIVDCDPIKFEYAGKRWLIEFWKGQYDLTTGCEIGVYTTDKSDFSIPNIFTGTFYDCVDDEDQLYMEFTLSKFGEILFHRGEKHWWLTGFKLGEFSEPYELIMDISITLKDKEMLDAFVGGLREANYSDKEFDIEGNTVFIKYVFPHTQQPLSRIKQAEWIIQRKNEAMCEKFVEITAGCMNMSEKLNALKEQSPDLYKKILHPGKSSAIFDVYKKIKNYLD
ncbi:MAG TPA: DUF4474 domain-containing protein [Pseudobacteroides sp.]|uniref:DUF4474 domain-containing protein n=1 Tax=Pseudobacteroides sp. TaxID=1968840 RepID=UPI002F93E274